MSQLRFKDFCKAYSRDAISYAAIAQQCRREKVVPEVPGTQGTFFLLTLDCMDMMED